MRGHFDSSFMIAVKKLCELMGLLGLTVCLRAYKLLKLLGKELLGKISELSLFKSISTCRYRDVIAMVKVSRFRFCDTIFCMAVAD